MEHYLRILSTSVGDKQDGYVRIRILRIRVCRRVEIWERRHIKHQRVSHKYTVVSVQ